LATPEDLATRKIITAKRKDKDSKGETPAKVPVPTKAFISKPHTLLNSKRESEVEGADGEGSGEGSGEGEVEGEASKPINSFAALLNSEEWECQACDVRNKKAATICAACETPREGDNEPVNAFARLLSSDEWECQACDVRNKKTAKICASCETLRENPEEAEDDSGPVFAFATTSDEWECSCGLRNASSALTCTLCEKPQNGATKTTASAAVGETGEGESDGPVFLFE